MSMSIEEIGRVLGEVQASFSEEEGITADLEKKAEIVREIRSRVDDIERKLTSEYTRRAGAIKSHNKDVDSINRAARRIIALSKEPLPIPTMATAEVKAAVKGRFQIEHAVNNAAIPVNEVVRACGVYFLLPDDEIVYIGQSVTVATRIADHTKDSTKVFNRSCYIAVDPAELDEVETALIALFKPKHNRRDVRLQGDESLELFYELPMLESA